MNFVSTVVYHCTAAFTQPGNHFLAQPCIRRAPTPLSWAGGFAASKRLRHSRNLCQHPILPRYSCDPACSDICDALRALSEQISHCRSWLYRISSTCPGISHRARAFTCTHNTICMRRTHEIAFRDPSLSSTGEISEMFISQGLPIAPRHAALSRASIPALPPLSAQPKVEN